MYSVGVVLMDMFRDHGVFQSEIIKIYDAQVLGQVEASIAKKMPEGVVELIESLIQKEPEQRMSSIQVLTR